jgi:protein gp37
MGKETHIAWTDHTFNPWIGCTKVSPGCDHCYAETLNHRWGNSNWGKGQPRRVTSDANWKQPLAWNREAEAAGRKSTVFCASMADVMDDEAPEGARDRLWELIDKTPNLIWQLLTKRPHRYQRYLPEKFKYDNVWLGTSAENQEFYDVRWPILELYGDEGFVLWVSYEPALGPVRMAGVGNGSPDWIIFGGESGSGRRPMESKWADDLLAECRTTGTKFFMKQMGAHTPAEGASMIPADLLIREFPEVKS